jgi:glyoxylase-like metal-dependent hydrolase (beta-lactamase superfamily II)
MMAWNTTVIAPPEGNMADYMNSLELLLGRNAPYFLPGHGGRLEDPERMVKAHLVHRRWREEAILGAIRRKVSTIEGIVDLVYKGLDDRLKVAASLSVQAHVEHLREKGLVTAQDPLTFQSRLEAV